MKRYAEFRKLVADGKALPGLIRMRKVGKDWVVPDDVMNKLHLKGIELAEPSNEEVFEYLQRKWGYQLSIGAGG